MGFTYGITLNLTGRKCIVVGGGAVAERKIITLLEENAAVTVISPTLTDGLMQLQEKFIWIADQYREHYLDSSFLVIAATNQRSVNQNVAQYCHDHQTLVNVVDSRTESNFTVNAMVKRGDLLLTVSTGGASPAMSRQIRGQLEQQFGSEYEQILNLVKAIRQEALQTIADEQKRREFLQQLGQIDFIAALQTETLEDLEKRVKLCLSSYWD